MRFELRLSGPLWEGDASAETRRLLKRTLAGLGAYLQGEAVMRAPVGATEALKGSIAHTVSAVGDELRVFTGQETAAYAIPVEYGTGPHPVSRAGRASLALWAQRKLGLNEKEAQAAAFLIARKIRRQGTRAQPFMGPALEENLSEIQRHLDALGIEIVRALGG